VTQSQDSGSSPRRTRYLQLQVYRSPRRPPESRSDRHGDSRVTDSRDSEAKIRVGVRSSSPGGAAVV
jgi:hypothetical protein